MENTASLRHKNNEHFFVNVYNEETVSIKI